MSEYEFTVSLRIRHPSTAPQYPWKAGDPRRDPAGGDRVGVYRESDWMRK